jgi:hypothetical protein
MAVILAVERWWRGGHVNDMDTCTVHISVLIVQGAPRSLKRLSHQAPRLVRQGIESAVRHWAMPPEQNQLHDRTPSVRRYSTDCTGYVGGLIVSTIHRKDYRTRTFSEEVTLGD